MKEILQSALSIYIDEQAWKDNNSKNLLLRLFCLINLNMSLFYLFTIFNTSFSGFWFFLMFNSEDV